MGRLLQLDFNFDVPKIVYPNFVSAPKLKVLKRGKTLLPLVDPNYNLTDTIARVKIIFQSVCKSWHHIINDLRFLRMHHDHTIQRPQNNDLFIVGLNKVYNPHIEVIKLKDQEFVPSMLNFPQETALLMGSCHGIILLKKSNPNSFVLLNPITRKRHEIPCLLVRLSCYGLYHDPKSDDYKIAILYTEVDDTWHYRVYSCKNTSWQEPKDLPSAMIPQRMAAFVDGCFYRCGDGEILCFDVRDEKLSKFSFPHDHLYLDHEVLIELSRHLCMYTVLEYRSGQWDIQLWKMEKHREKYSWRKLMDFKTKNNVFWIQFVGLSKNDDVVVILIRDIDIKCQCVEMIYDQSEMKLKEFNNGGFKATIILPYSESLYFPIQLS